MLPRRHELATATYGGGPPPEQDIPLDIPKNETVLRPDGKGAEMAPEMHRRFQQETVNLQVTTAKAYLELLQRGEIAGARSHGRRRDQGGGGGQGFSGSKGEQWSGDWGPLFTSRGRGGESRRRISVTDSYLVSYNPEKYKSPKPLIQIGALVPGIPLKCIFELECLDVNAVDEEVEIQVLPSQLEDSGDGSIGKRRELQCTGHEPRDDAPVIVCCRATCPNSAAVRGTFGQTFPGSEPASACFPRSDKSTARS